MIPAIKGGEKHRLRYIVVVGLLHTPLPEKCHHIIERVWHTICERYDSQIERIQFQPSYMKVTLLVSMETAVGTVLEEGINTVNADEQLLYQDYFVTKVKVPPDDEIQEYLNEVRQ